MKKNNLKKGNIKVKNILILFVIITVIVMLSTKVLAKSDMPTKVYTVESNDTLWKIASNICKKSENKNLNTQKVIIEIKKLNSINSTNIYVGQELILPIYY